MIEIDVPGDKSITHRALILSALARGRSRLRGLLPAADPRATAGALRALGVDVPAVRDGEVVVDGVGLAGFSAPADPIDCHNSGTTARLLLGVLAGLPFQATVTGDESLRARPMRRVTEPLSAMGADVSERGEPDRLPVQIAGGPLEALDYETPRASAQVKSALLLAGCTGGARVRVRQPAVSRDHTERLLRAMGADVVLEREPDGGSRARLLPPDTLAPLDLRVPGDFSSAAFLLALALLSPGGELRIRGVGVNPTRTGLLDVFARMGAEVSVEDPRERHGEPTADLVARPTRLEATEVSAPEIPLMIDEVPVLAILAARAEGVTRIRGAEELRVKESDRLAALAENLRAVGVTAEEHTDGLAIAGSDAPLAGRVRSFGDHRIAMAFGALAALPENDIVVEGREAAAVSFPGFWPLLERTASALRGRP